MRFFLLSLFSFSFCLALCSTLEKPFMPAILFCSVCVARAIFLASLFTCPLFISPTRKPRAGLNTRVNPIRCKCFRARPSPSLPVLHFPLFLSLFRAFLPISFTPIVFFCREAFSSWACRRFAHGAYIYGCVCVRFEAPRSRGLHDNVIARGEEE